WKAVVIDVLGLAEGVGCIGLRQRAVGAGASRVDRIDVGVIGLLLGGQRKVGARGVGRGYDTLRQQVAHRLPGGRLVGRKQIIERVIFGKNHQQVLDRRGGRKGGGVVGGRHADGAGADLVLAAVIAVGRQRVRAVRQGSRIPAVRRGSSRGQEGAINV